MSRTTGAMADHLVWPMNRQAARGQTRQLMAEWQEGPTTISGYAPRKLRLTFALPTPSSFAQTAFRGTALGLSAKEERI